MLDEVVMTELRVLGLQQRHPFEIVAMEELLLNNVASRTAPATLAFNQWKPSAVTISRFQALSDVNLKKCADEGIVVVRTQVGGRSVYHDARHSISFCAALPDNVFSSKVFEDQTAVYSFFLERIKYGLLELGVPAEVIEKNYLRVAGKKIAGTALRIKKGKEQQRAAVIHGVILYDIPDTDAYVSYMLDLMMLDGHPRHEYHAEIAKKITAIRSHLPQVTREQLCEAITHAFVCNEKIVGNQLSSEEQQELAALVKNKYSNPEWYKGTEYRGLCFKPYGPIPVTRGWSSQA